MSNDDEITGRLAVLEAFVMTALGLYLARAFYDKVDGILSWRGMRRILFQGRA